MNGVWVCTLARRVYIDSKAFPCNVTDLTTGAEWYYTLGRMTGLYTRGISVAQALCKVYPDVDVDLPPS